MDTVLDDEVEVSEHGRVNPLVWWAVGIVLTAVLALAGIAVNDNRSLVRDQGTRIEQVNAAQVQLRAENAEKNAALNTRVTILEYQYNEILRRLDAIDRKVSH